MNAILGAKISIVSDRPQTTREAILGILNEPSVQMIFVDTPGWLKPKDNFQSFMKRAVVRTIYDDADVLLWLIEPRDMTPEEIEFGQMLGRINKPIICAINKMDKGADKEIITGLQASIKKILPQSSIHLISARSKQGLPELQKDVFSHLPAGDPFYPVDQMTDRWERFYVAELIREQIFNQFREEVPHAAMVHVEDFVEKEGRKDHIKVRIYVETEGQKKIVVGNKGFGIKKLGEASRREIENHIGRPVYLEMMVKVQKNWRADAEFIKSLENNHF